MRVHFFNLTHDNFAEFEVSDDITVSIVVQLLLHFVWINMNIPFFKLVLSLFSLSIKREWLECWCTIVFKQLFNLSDNFLKENIASFDVAFKEIVEVFNANYKLEDQSLKKLQQLI